MTPYQAGLLHFAYLLVMVDGQLDQREQQMLMAICAEEELEVDAYNKFLDEAAALTEHQIYQHGLELLNTCSTDEKIAAMVHLFRLSEADNNLHKKEVRLLFYALQLMDVDFEDVELSARLSSSRG